MLRCRRCRKGVLDSTCLATVDDTSEGSAAACSIWHVNVDTLPEWILTSVHQAQWTVGKLSCQNCRARLGSFNFINRSECPCGRDITIHLNKSRVDRDHKRYILIVQPRTRTRTRTRPEEEQADRLIHWPQEREEGAELNGTALDSTLLNCSAVVSHISPAETSSSLTHSENTQSFPFSPLHCISQRRRCSLLNNAAFRSSCFCPARLKDKSVVDASRTGPRNSIQSPVSFPISWQFETDSEASFNAGTSRPSVSRGRQSPLEAELLQTVAGVEPSVETTAIFEGTSDSAPFLRRRTGSDGAAEQEEEVVPQDSPVSIKLSKTEKNHLKSLRRKQRRRERWLHSQLEQEQAGSVSSSLLDSEEENREGLTCAVCLDIYYSPFSCQPCGHSFCEPCLRTLARNRPTNTPCPLCRALISHTSFHKELAQAAKTFFPKVYNARTQNFQSAPCAKWPLPSFHKGFRIFWGSQRQAAPVRRRWPFAHGGFTQDILHLTDMRGWLFDIGLVIVCIHSVNWILAFLFLCFLMYCYFF